MTRKNTARIEPQKIICMSMAFLQTLGLSKNEADLYELLLKLGDVPIATVLKEVHMKRPTVYNTLYTLEQKGLVTKQDKHKKIHFQPAPPSKLLELAESQFTNLDRAKADIQAVLPTLMDSYTLSVAKPVIRIFEGAAGVKKAHMELLAEKKDILAYVKLNEDIDSALEGFWPQYYAHRRKYRIFAKVITPDTKSAKVYKNNDVSELRETRIVPAEKFPIDIEKDIVGNKIAFFSVTDDKRLLVTIIENKAIADAERAIFGLVWEQANQDSD